MRTLDQVAAWMKARAGEFQMVNPEFANTLAWYSEQLPHLDKPIPPKRPCEECGADATRFSWLCHGSADYKAGYRAVWKCTNPACGEMEVV